MVMMIVVVNGGSSHMTASHVHTSSLDLFARARAEDIPSIHVHENQEALQSAAHTALASHEGKRPGKQLTSQRIFRLLSSGQ